LARDIGVTLNTAAHLLELRRTRSSGFSVVEACSLDETLHALESGGVLDLIGLRRALSRMPEIEVSEAVAIRVRNGDASALAGLVSITDTHVKVVSNERLVAVASHAGDKLPELLRVFV
jgi:tRNA U55 pseudouridine synthase TruB